MKTRVFAHVALVAGFLCVVGGCDEQEGSGEPATTPSCPPVASECPSDCRAAMARAFDAEQGCRAEAESLIGCNAPELTSSDAACYRRLADATLWLGSSSVFDSALYERCSEAQSSAAASAPFCP